MKVAEAGPADLRPNPIHLRDALNRLVRSDQVRSEHPPSPRDVTLPVFYTPADFSVERTSDRVRRERVIDLYTTFLRAGREDEGKTLERTVYRAALEARRAGRYLTVIGSPDRPPDAALVLDDVPVAGALDLILVARGGMVAIEDKNLREWLGPSSEEVWALIGKALRHDALPVLICRKVTYDLFFLFKQIGALAFQVHRQMFPLEFAERLAFIKHKDGLGFHDIRFGDDPPPSLTHFMSETIPRYLEEKIALFREKAPLLREYAIEAGLEEEIPGEQRSLIYRDFFRRLKGWDDMPPDY